MCSCKWRQHFLSGIDQIIWERNFFHAGERGTLELIRRAKLSKQTKRQTKKEEAMSDKRRRDMRRTCKRVLFLTWTSPFCPYGNVMIYQIDCEKKKRKAPMKKKRDKNDDVKNCSYVVKAVVNRGNLHIFETYIRLLIGSSSTFIGCHKDASNATRGK